MSTARETVMTALFAKLETIGAFVVSSRRNREPASIGPAQSPALFVLEDGEEFVYHSESLPPIQRLMPKVVFYNNVGAANNLVPATVINALLDALVEALKPTSPTGLFTLGGLVDSVIIKGEVKKAPGDVTGAAVAIVPLVITLP